MGRSILHIMLKLARGLCNPQCMYCFYVDETAKREVETGESCSVSTLKNVLGKALAECCGELTVAFQGGEPNSGRTQFF